MEIEAELVRRYEILIRNGQTNIYCQSKEKWKKEVQEKIFELNSIISQNNRWTLSQINHIIPTNA